MIRLCDIPKDKIRLFLTPGVVIEYIGDDQDLFKYRDNKFLIVDIDKDGMILQEPKPFAHYDGNKILDNPYFGDIAYIEAWDSFGINIKIEGFEL